MNNETLAYFFVFFISTLVGFGLVYKHATHKMAKYTPHLCIERILARCAPADESEKLVREDRSRANGGLSLGAQEFFSEERRKKIVEMYVKKDSDQYRKILAAFNDAFDRKDEEMLICLEKHMTTYNNEPSCHNLKEKEVSSEMMMLYFGGVIVFSLLVTLFVYGISSFFL